MYERKSSLILGFHGCDKSVRDLLLNDPDKIFKSEKPYDWLGNGIYFWENNYERALQWAKDKAFRKEIKEAAVIGAVLTLDNCFDLLDSKYPMMLNSYFDNMSITFKIDNKPLPVNLDSKDDQNKDKILRYLDCSVIEFMHQFIKKEIDQDIKESGFSNIREFDSARGVFIEGGPAFEGAGIQMKSHIQICIRNSNSIKGFFLPRKEIY